MSKIIKFRVWDTRENKGVATEEMLYDAQNHRLWHDFIDYPKCYVIMQYTGLKDRNGKEIYEGDIIRAKHDFGPAGFQYHISSVKWDNEVGYQWHYWDLSTIEVIGNVFENSKFYITNEMDKKGAQ